MLLIFQNGERLLKCPWPLILLSYNSSPSPINFVYQLINERNSAVKDHNSALKACSKLRRSHTKKTVAERVRVSQISFRCTSVSGMQSSCREFHMSFVLESVVRRNRNKLQTSTLFTNIFLSERTTATWSKSTPHYKIELGRRFK